MAQTEGFAEMLASFKEKVEGKVRQSLLEPADRLKRLKTSYSLSLQITSA